MNQPPTNEELWDAIQRLDFQLLKDKLRTRKGWWWRWRNNLDTLEAQYRQFLYLIATNRGKTVVPWSEPLDDFWHEHILDTRKYHDDCQAIFGNIVHHNPHLSKGSPPQARAFEETKRMYREAFDKRRTDQSAVGCSGAFYPVFYSCSGSGWDSTSHAPPAGHSHHGCGDAMHHSGSDAGADASGGHGTSCGVGSGGGDAGGDESCGGGSSCGGGGCGGGCGSS